MMKENLLIGTAVASFTFHAVIPSSYRKNRFANIPMVR